MIRSSTAAEALQIDWGTVPDWVAAVGTVLAFVVAAAAYAGSIWLSRKAQARQVSMSQLQVEVVNAGEPLGNEMPMAILGVPIKFDRFQAHGPITQLRAAKLSLTVVNNSNEVMGPVSIEFARTGERAFLADAHTVIERIQPHQESSTIVVIPDRWHPIHPPLHARMVFRDSAGRWWQRFENERVRRAPRGIRPPEHDHAQAKTLFKATSVEWPPPPKPTSGWRLVGNVKDGVHVATDGDKPASDLPRDDPSR